MSKGERLDAESTGLRAGRRRPPLSGHIARLRQAADSPSYGFSGKKKQREVQRAMVKYIRGEVDAKETAQERTAYLAEVHRELYLLYKEYKTTDFDSRGVVRVVIEQVGTLFDHWKAAARRRNAGQESTPEEEPEQKANALPSDVKRFRYRGTRAELRYLLNEIYKRRIDHARVTKKEFFLSIAPLFEDGKGKAITEEDVTNMLKKTSAPPSTAHEVDGWMDDAEEHRFDDRP